MAINPDKPGVVVNQENLALVDRKMGSPVPFRPSAHGVYASWDVPMESLEKDLSSEQRRQIEKSRQRNPVQANLSIQRVFPSSVPMIVGPPSDVPSLREVVIPLQAMKPFKTLLGHMFELRVILTDEQAKMLLESLQAMPTPKKMMDAKAIFDVCTQLERQVKSV